MPSVPLGDIQGTHASEIEGVRPGYESIHNLLRCAQPLYCDEFSKYHIYDNEFIPDLLPDNGPSTG
jgi:hypothetical protein